MNTTTLTPDQQQILQIAERYNAYPGSGGLHIRGVEDVLEFADEVQGLALEEVETCGKRTDLSKCLAKDFWREQAIREAVITDPAKIHDTFEHDQQCDDMAGVPSASII